MPDPVDLDLTAVARHRDLVHGVESRQTQLRVELSRRAAELEALQREGANATRLARARDRVGRLEQERDELSVRRTDLIDRFDHVIGEIIGPAGVADHLDPGRLVTALDANVPVALLPVRIETRFGANGDSLDIRIFPDQIHLDAHEPEFTVDEREGATWYWEQRWPQLDDPALGAAAWDALSGRFRPGRARYLIDTLRPSNLDAAPGGAPAFPTVDSRAGSWTRAVTARLLPHRWVAVGYQGGTEVFRKWSGPVRAGLHAGPSPAVEDTPPPLPDDATTPLVQADLAWAFDLHEATLAGMALTVGQADLPTGRLLRRGLDKLLVFGVDWTQTPETGADAFDRLLSGHAATGDLAFVAPGTATNNTGVNRSGFSTAPSAQVAEWAPPLSGADPDTTPDAAAGRLAAALGIAADGVATVPGAGNHYRGTESALVDALWEASGGYYCSDMLDPLVSDRLTNALRTHAVSHVAASGPLPNIRVGPQPYGVLPVVAGSYRPTPGDRAEEAIARVGSAMRSLWAPLTDRVPHLGRAGEQGDVDDIMLDILQRTPVPWQMRFRDMTPPPQWSASDWMTNLRTQQAPYLYTIMSRLGVSTRNAARVQYLTATESYPLNVPLVLKGGDGLSYLAEIASLTRSGTAGRRDLNLRQNSLALLEALLAFAATQEMDKPAHGLHFEAAGPQLAAAAASLKLGVRTPDLVRVDETATLGPLQFATARDLAASIAPGTNRTVHDELQVRIADKSPAQLQVDAFLPLRTLGRFLGAVDTLAGSEPDDLEWAFRGVLDLYSTRLDAWLTSLATSRLARQRAARPVGLHIGCFGWVEDLARDTGDAAESLGYVLAPSLNHAVGAAVLRSGRQAHADTGAFDLDLSSQRVREAMTLLEGVAAGQSIAALVGYRVERRLREAQLADVTVPLRIVAPLQSRDPERETPVESVAARDVVDGVTLLSKFAAGGATWNTLLSHIPIGTRQSRLEAVLRDVAENYDAVTDVLFAETIHQTAMGNLDRAGAAAGALDRQERPVEPDVVRTPRAGAIVTSRIMISVRQRAAVAGWPSRGARGNAEPRLDRWLGIILGPPEDLTVRGRHIRPGASEDAAPTITDLGVVTAKELRLSPLALVLTAQRPSTGGRSELEHRVCRVLEDRHEIAPGDRVECDTSSLLHTLSGWAARLVGGARPLAPTDLVLAETAGSVLAGTTDLAELTGRVDGAIESVRSAVTALQTVSRSPAAMRSALLSVSELAGGAALPAARPGDPDEAAVLVAQLDDVTLELDRRMKSVDDLAGTPLGASDPVARQLELLAGALGSQQPILPMFTLANPDELATSLADRAALVAGEDTAPLAWLHRSSLVRPELTPFAGLLTHAEAAGRNVTADVSVAQLPHRPGVRWCELPFGPEGPPPAGTIGLVVMAPEGFDPVRDQCGLFIDAFAEQIPATEHTAGLTFHFDAPGARPPQAIVLAVHPDPVATRWDIDTLIDTVNETAALARLRTLSAREIEGFAGLLPALYLPNNYTRDVPSVSFKVLQEFAATKGLTKAFTGVKGK